MRRLKYTIDRKSLESIYIAFIRLLSGITAPHMKNMNLDKIQNEAASSVYEPISIFRDVKYIFCFCFKLN